MSALVRGEFLLIQTAFDHMPRITTTGLFDTVFNQLGNYTFTLPGAPGTLATTANIATETARALAAEGVLGTAVGAETTARIAGDVTEAAARAAAIGVETTRATAAEGVNATAITTETTARTTAIAGEVTARNTAIGVETTRATAAEAAAQTTANAALPKAGGTMTGDVNLGGHALTNVATAGIGAMTATTGTIAGLTSTAAVIGSATIGSGGSFLSSLGASGYQKLPGGFIKQWGNGTTVAGGGVAASYPIAFPSACAAFSAFVNGAVGPLPLTIVGGAAGTTFTNVWCANSTTGAAAVGIGFYWEAVGS